MNNWYMIEEESGGKSLFYEWDPDHTVFYQKEMLERQVGMSLLDPTFTEAGIHYRCGENRLIQAPPGQFHAIRQALQKLLADGEDAFLDMDHWVWDPEWWSWDPTEDRLQGVYLPDRRQHDDIAVFLTGWAEQWIRRSLKEEWTDAESILLVHRFFIEAGKIKRGEKDLGAFLEENTDRQPALTTPGTTEFPVAFPAVSKPRVSLMERIRRAIFGK